MRRVNRPVASEPRPSRPRNGSGEAVCGRLPALLPAAPLLCAVVSVPVEAGAAPEAV